MNFSYMNSTKKTVLHVAMWIKNTVYDKTLWEGDLQFLWIFANCECFTTENFPAL